MSTDLAETWAWPLPQADPSDGLGSSNIGIRCRIDGLSGRADLNGKTCKLLRLDAEALSCGKRCGKPGVNVNRGAASRV